MEKALNEQYQMLKKLLNFSDFKISLRHCGVVNAFSDPNITMCVELIEDTNAQGLGSAAVFVFFHELGHTFLRTWNLPSYENEDLADEFATAFMMMAQQKAGALQAAQWWANQTSEQEALSKLWQDDRHSVSPQRARNIIRWINQEHEILPRWYRVLIPNMKTEILLDLLNRPAPGVDPELVRAELVKRGVASQ